MWYTTKMWTVDFIKKSLIMNAPLVGCPFPVSPASKFAIIKEITSVQKLNHIVFFLKLHMCLYCECRKKPEECM